MSGGAPARKGSGTRAAATISKRRRGGRSSPPSSTAAAGATAAVDLLYARLRDKYGTPRPESHQPPLEELVFTILSQNTTDTNRDRAWASLWRHFDSWEQVAAARVDSISKAIAVGGLHKVKARRIKDILRQIKKERGGFDLDDLQDLPLDEARLQLAGYKGIGAKSINCILLFSLGLPAFPVDTHVHRILRRLGIVETKDLAKANRDIQVHVDDEIAYPLHMNVIRYGREVCHARRPECWACCIEDLCSYDEKNLE